MERRDEMDINETTNLTGISWLMRMFSFSWWEVGCISVLSMIIIFVLYGIRNHWKFTKRVVIAGVLLSIYIGVVIGLTLLNRTSSEDHRTILKFLWSYGAWIQGNKQALWEIVGNIVMLIPYGILLPILEQKFRKFRWILLASFGFTLFIELSQYFTCRGWFELDDLFHNTVGGVVGFQFFQITRKIYKRQWGIDMHTYELN